MQLLLFISMVWDDVPELRPPTGLLSTPQVIYLFGEPRWNDTDRGKLKNSEKSLFQRHFVRHKSHMDWQVRERRHPWWEAGD
jgi:hypothetical protein